MADAMTETTDPLRVKRLIEDDLDWWAAQQYPPRTPWHSGLIGLLEMAAAEIRALRLAQQGTREQIEALPRYKVTVFDDIGRGDPLFERDCDGTWMKAKDILALLRGEGK